MKTIYWILLVIVILIVGGYFYRNNLRTYFMGGYSAPTATSQTATTVTAPLGTVVNNEIVITKTDQTKGNYLAGPNGMTLYIFDKDQPGISNCSGGCATLWPPYITAAAPITLPANITTLTRTDGTIQFAWNQMPLYYYSPDKVPGDTTGDGVGGLWHTVKP